MNINQEIHDAMLVAQRFTERFAATEAARTAINNLLHAATNLTAEQKAALYAALEATNQIKDQNTSHAAVAYLKTL